VSDGLWFDIVGFKVRWVNTVLTPDVNPHCAYRDLREYLERKRFAWARPTTLRRVQPRRVRDALFMREALAEVERIAPA
jgi:hypothetical protein